MSMKNHCVQCGEKLTGTNGYENQILHFCDNPSCPNYGLMAFSVEEMTSMDWVRNQRITKEGK